MLSQFKKNSVLTHQIILLIILVTTLYSQDFESNSNRPRVAAEHQVPSAAQAQRRTSSDLPCARTAARAALMPPTAANVAALSAGL